MKTIIKEETEIAALKAEIEIAKEQQQFRSYFEASRSNVAQLRENLNKIKSFKAQEIKDSLPKPVEKKYNPEVFTEPYIDKYKLIE